MTPSKRTTLRRLSAVSAAVLVTAFADFQLAEVAKWGKVIKDAGIQAE